MKTPIYLDYNATTPHDPDVIGAMQPFLAEYFGNPSSSYWFGVQTKEAVKNARRQVASLLNCDPSEIVFTSGGTESNNYAIKGAALKNQHRGNHIITTQIEHPSVLEVCRFLEMNGFRLTYLPVDENGIVEVADFEKAITSKTILITVMHSNNEVGSIQPIEEISTLARERGILIHTDAAQSIGKIPADVKRYGVDLLSIAGHKVYAPKGVGALYIRRGIQLSALIHGAGQEDGRRPGTDNVLEIVGFGKAAEILWAATLKTFTVFIILSIAPAAPTNTNLPALVMTRYPFPALTITSDKFSLNMDSTLIFDVIVKALAIPHRASESTL